MMRVIIFILLQICLIDGLQSQVRFDSTYTSYFRRCGGSSGWNAGDATISLALPDQRVLWLFGDSYTDRPVCGNHKISCLYDVRNCMMIQNATQPNVFNTQLSLGSGLARTTFKYGTDNQINYFLWPGHGFVNGDTTYIFLHRWYSSTGIVIDSFAGNFIAKLNTQTLAIHSIDSLRVSLDFHFGRAVIRHEESGYIYVYNNRQENGFYRVYISRTPISQPLQSWQYYNGSGWVSDINASLSISPVSVSSSFSAFVKNNQVYILTQEPFGNICSFGREIYAMESDQFTGPFNLKRLIYTVEDTLDGNYLATYNAQAHPWINGDLLVSYNVNDNAGDTINCPAQCRPPAAGKTRDADSYRPKFIRVPFSELMIQGLLDQTDLFLVAGQSNAVGQGDAAESEEPNFGTAFQIDMSKRLLYPLKDPVGYNDIFTGFQKANSGSFLPALARTLNSRCQRIPLFIHTAKANTFCHPVNSSQQFNWSSGGLLFNQSVNQVNQISVLTGRPLSAVIWSQGESDGGAIRQNLITENQYQLALEDLIQRFRAQFGSQLPFFMIRTGRNLAFDPDPGYSSVRNVQDLVASVDPRTWMVYDSTFYFPELGWMKDDVHYNQKGLNQLGVASADSICRVLYADDYMADDNLAKQNDEFENECSSGEWTHVSVTEGWNATHLNEFSINESGNGKMIMEPHTTTWYADYKGPLVYKPIHGNFSVTTNVHFSNRAGNNLPFSDYSLAGIMLRTPKELNTGAAGWVAGQENYIFMSAGFASTSHPSCPGCPGPHIEIKTTINSNSQLHIRSVNSQEVLLKVARIGSYFIVMFSTNGGQDFTIAARYHRPDMPDTLQVGLVTYSDWAKASTYTPIFHNNNNLVQGMSPDPSSNQGVPFNPDLRAEFDYIRFENFYVPGAWLGLDISDSAMVSNQQILSIFDGNGKVLPEYVDAKIWSGRIDSNWMNPQNWQGATLPNQNSRVIIPDCLCSGVFAPVLNSAQQVRSVVIHPGGKLTIGSAGDLTLQDEDDFYRYLFDNEGECVIRGIMNIQMLMHQTINRGNLQVTPSGILQIYDDE